MRSAAISELQSLMCASEELIFKCGIEDVVLSVLGVWGSEAQSG
jgi:hypothetical protein